LQNRVPTICFNVKGMDASVIADHCAAAGIGVRDGNMYSPRLLHRMGIPARSGAVRASLVHYNTVEEIDKFAGVLQQISRQ
jgi:selenocysteine lyase/cysteine desulfurase